MSHFDEYLKASREALASFIAAVTTQAREALHPATESASGAWIRHVDRADLSACQDSLARIGPGGFPAALHSLLCERLDSVRAEALPSSSDSELPASGGKLTFTLKDLPDVKLPISFDPNSTGGSSSNNR